MQPLSMYVCHVVCIYVCHVCHVCTHTVCTQVAGTHLHYKHLLL